MGYILIHNSITNQFFTFFGMFTVDEVGWKFSYCEAKENDVERSSELFAHFTTLIII